MPQQYQFNERVLLQKGVYCIAGHRKGIFKGLVGTKMCSIHIVGDNKATRTIRMTLITKDDESTAGNQDNGVGMHIVSTSKAMSNESAE